MYSIKTFAAVAAVVAMSASAQAGLFGHQKGCGASKSCDCAPTFQPECCRPTICRPNYRTVHNYQRTCAKPRGYCHDACSDTNGCAPLNNGSNCTNVIASNNNGACVTHGAACDNNCVPGTYVGKKKFSLFNHKKKFSLFGKHDRCDDACDAVDCCPPVDACELAELIYISQTGCYPRERKKAIRKLDRKYDCRCNPEIMSAFIYALNDADPGVREVAADKIGDQIRKNPCCCSPEVISALTCALADCHRGTRKEAEEALKLCGYDVVDCVEACDTTCAPVGNACAPVGAPVQAPVQAPSVAPAPVNGSDVAPAPPVEGDSAYFPKRIQQQNAGSKKSLSNLFSLAK